MYKDLKKNIYLLIFVVILIGLVYKINSIQNLLPNRFPEKIKHYDFSPIEGVALEYPTVFRTVQDYKKSKMVFTAKVTNIKRDLQALSEAQKNLSSNNRLIKEELSRYKNLLAETEKKILHLKKAGGKIDIKYSKYRKKIRILKLKIVTLPDQLKTIDDYYKSSLVVNLEVIVSYKGEINIGDLVSFTYKKLPDQSIFSSGLYFIKNSNKLVTIFYNQDINSISSLFYSPSIDEERTTMKLIKSGKYRDEDLIIYD